MDFQTFSTFVLQAALAAAPLVDPRRLVKKIVDLALDRVVPVHDDGSAYTREELLDTFDVLLAGDLSAYALPATASPLSEDAPADEASAHSASVATSTVTEVPEPETSTSGPNDPAAMPRRSDR